MCIGGITLKQKLALVVEALLLNAVRNGDYLPSFAKSCSSIPTKFPTGLRVRHTAATDETWSGEAEVETSVVSAGPMSEAARRVVPSSHWGIFQPQDEPGRKNLAVAQPEGARTDWQVSAHGPRRSTLLITTMRLDIDCWQFGAVSETIGLHLSRKQGRRINA